MTLDVGIASLGDMQPRTVDGGHRTAVDRVQQIVALRELAEQVGLDHFGLGSITTVISLCPRQPSCSALSPPAPDESGS